MSVIGVQVFMVYNIYDEGLVSPVIIMVIDLIASNEEAVLIYTVSQDFDEVDDENLD